VLANHTRSVRLFCSIDASALAAVLFVLVLVMMIVEPSSSHHGYGPDLPKVSHSVPMSGSEREDAVIVTVVRDGSIYLGADRVSPDQVGSKILDRLKDRSVERRVYIRADARVWYRSVKEVLDGMRSAGIERVAFIVDQRRSPTSSGSPLLSPAFSLP
jgi:biopolymer transport protein TolR